MLSVAGKIAKKGPGQAGMTKCRSGAFFCHSRKRSASGILLLIALFLTALPAGGEAQAAPKGKYKRTVERYNVPDLTLLNQDGKKIKLSSILDPGKPVIIDFIYTTCTTICPVLSSGYLNMQHKLGEATETVQLVSISIDPENDRPEQMKKYLQMFGAKKGWDFLTGSRNDIILVMKTFDASVPDKMTHIPLYILRGPKSDEWVRLHGLVGSSDLMSELRRLQNK
jgi:protein SCO1/2